MEPGIREHICAPSPVQHLVKIFSERCYAAVEENPMREIGDIYKSIRLEMTANMTEDEMKLFFEDIPDKLSIAPQLYEHRRLFIPKEPENFVSYNNQK